MNTKFIEEATLTQNTLCAKHDSFDYIATGTYARIEQDSELPRFLRCTDFLGLTDFIHGIKRGYCAVNLSTTLAEVSTLPLTSQFNLTMVRNDNSFSIVDRDLRVLYIHQKHFLILCRSCHTATD